MNYVALMAYVLCAVTSLVCAVLLLRSWMRTKSRLLFWSTLCFVGLAADNLLMFYDFVVIPKTDIALYRNMASLIGIGCLVFGLIMETGDA